MLDQRKMPDKMRKRVIERALKSNGWIMTMGKTRCFFFFYFNSSACYYISGDRSHPGVSSAAQRLTRFGEIFS